MLASDITVRNTLAIWCSLPDDVSLDSTLQSAIALNSSMSNSTNPFETKMHEDLYKDATLQNWMQEKGAIRFAHYWQECYYVYRPKSWYDWILVDSYRDEIVNELANTYFCEQTNLVGSSKYHWGGTLSVKRKVNKGTNEYDFVYEFSPNGELRVGLKESINRAAISFKPEDIEDGWICRKKYNYKTVTAVSNIISFISTVEKEVFVSSNTDSLLCKLP